jgi:hypothetical protein
MKRFIVIAVAVASVAGTGVAWSALAASSNSVAVVGGGHFDAGASLTRFDGTPAGSFPLARDFNYHVHQAANGTASGTVLYGTNGGTTSSLNLSVSCMTVVGNAAVVGGTVAGQPAVAGFFFVVDNGGPGNASPDRVSPLTILDRAAPVLVAAGFPKHCGLSPTGGDGLYTDLLAGDISSHSGP